MMIDFAGINMNIKQEKHDTRV